MLLISDKKAMRVPGKNHISVLNVLALLLACKETGVPDEDEIAVIVRDLESRKLIIRYENGMSKMVKLADSLKIHKNKNQGN